MKAVSFEKVCFSYEQEETEQITDFDTAEGTFSLSGVDFSVEEGEFVAVLGHNGSGKSTLARLIDGLLMPSAGKITVLGEEVNEENLFEIRKQVGIVFQNPDNQTVASIVEDDVAFGPENIGVSREEIGERIDFALSAVGMSEHRFSSVSRLSGGQKQRIAIAGVLALKPKIMILDESTAMLDPIGRKEVMDAVIRLNKEEKITVLLITHFPEEAMLADRAIVMSRGKIVVEGDPFEIFTRESELKECGLSLPMPLKICRALQKGGLPVKDCLTPKELAEEIFRAKALGVKTDASFLCGRAKPLVGSGYENGVFAKNVSYTYNPSSPFETHALEGVDLTVYSGDFFGVVGHTGSGKSTFVQHLNALLKLPTAEKKYKEKRRKKALPQVETKLEVAGYDLTKKTTDFRALRGDVGMVFQYPEYQLFAETVFEDVAFGLKNFASEKLTEKEIEEAVKEAIEEVGLCFEEVRNRSPFELSGGQKRRVAIAGVLVTKPRVLVLDEPAAGLDPLGKAEIMKLLHRIHGGWCKTVIVVSHDMDEIAENCTRAAVFAGGKVVRIGEVKRVFDDGICKAGLDLPFTAKTERELEKLGVVVKSDLTRADFVKKVLEAVDKKGEGQSDE